MKTLNIQEQTVANVHNERILTEAKEKNIHIMDKIKYISKEKTTINIKMKETPAKAKNIKHRFLPIFRWR